MKHVTTPTVWFDNTLIGNPPKPHQISINYPIYMEQNNLDRYLDCYMDQDPEDAPVYMGHSLFNITKGTMIVFIVQSLFDGPEIAIHQISGLKWSR